MDLLSRTPFQACSDGSAVTKQGTFGWVLALPDRTRLAFGAGPVDGHDPQSFRSEGQGMLSVVCLLARLKQWTKSDAVLSGVLATDNSGLVDRVQGQTKIRYPVPNNTFQSDWDVVEAIARTVETAKLDVSYKHVKGHQDNDKTYASLSLASLTSYLTAEDMIAFLHEGEVSIHKGAGVFSDGIIKGSELISDDVLKTIESTGKPVLEYFNHAEMGKSYIDFYNAIESENLVGH